MSIFSLVWSYLKSKPLNTALNVFLLALGIAVITVLLLVNKQLEEKITSNAKGIDLVVGAKGSPLQLILCNIFHIDFPTGNINLKEAERISKGRLIKNAIPLALGDSYQAYRIVGTTTKYTELYKAELASGNWWKNEMEVVVGANVAEGLKLKTGDKFESTHGLTQEGQSHEEGSFVVTGVLKRGGNVVDNLILTSVESIWHVHSHSEEPEDQSDTVFVPSTLIPTHIAGDSTKEITSLLIQYRSPMAAIQLPRMINSQSMMQAASPAFETARLFSILGVAIDVLKVFAYVLVFISGLSIFIALYNSLKERRYDLAIMRSMGASRFKLFISVLLEGSTITFFGTALGLLFSHSVISLMAVAVEQARKGGISGFVFYPEEGIILVGSLFLGLLCALLPAVQAYRTDISKVLAGN
jgi:putative ABC transport system permease protein